MLPCLEATQLHNAEHMQVSLGKVQVHSRNLTEETIVACVFLKVTKYKHDAKYLSSIMQQQKFQWNKLRNRDLYNSICCVWYKVHFSTNKFQSTIVYFIFFEITPFHLNMLNFCQIKNTFFLLWHKASFYATTFSSTLQYLLTYVSYCLLCLKISK